MVLLADHDPEFRASIAFHLALAGYPVIQAQSVSEVVRAGRTHRPGLMIVADEFDERDIVDLFAILAATTSPGRRPGDHRVVRIGR